MPEPGKRGQWFSNIWQVLATIFLSIVIFAGKAQVRDIVREQTLIFETKAESDARWQAHEREIEGRMEILKGEILTLSARLTNSENNYKALNELTSEIKSMKVQIEILMASYRKRYSIDSN